MDLAPDFEFIGALTPMGLNSSSSVRMRWPYTGRPASPLDILGLPTFDNAARLLRTLEAFGFPVADLTHETIMDRPRMLQMGAPPVQIHVMSAISGVAWDEASSDRAEGSLGTHTVQFLGRDTFLRNKRAAGRPKDLADIDALEPGRDV